MNIIVHARPTQDLPGGKLPTHVQWMPPGWQRVQPMGFDAPFEMNITPALAAKAAQQLQQLRSNAAAGKDVEPYLDANHRDEVRLAKAQKFWWGGNDVKAGGIRLDVEWTGAGVEAVNSGGLPCVSASWALNKFTKEFIGIAPNVGGLVPRSAFTAIQVFAKSGASTTDADPFVERVKQVMKEEGIDEQMARGIVLKNEPELWKQHLYRVIGIDEEQAQRLGVKLAIETAAKVVTPKTYNAALAAMKALVKAYGDPGIDSHPLCVQARALAETEKIDFSEASMRVAAKNPALYNDYRSAVTRR